MTTSPIDENESFDCWTDAEIEQQSGDAAWQAELAAKYGEYLEGDDAGE